MHLIKIYVLPTTCQVLWWVLEKVRWKAYFYPPAVWNPADLEEDSGGGVGWKGDELKKHHGEQKVTEEFTKQVMWAKCLMHYVQPD